MADYSAIRGVSATLSTLLRDRMQNGSVGVTLLPPDVPPDVAADRINLFLYRITENPFLSNQDLPRVGHPALPGNPPLALKLHYLMTAYTMADPDLDAQALELLGDAMRVLHDYAIIPESLEQVRLVPGDPILDDSLHGEFEQIKVCLDQISVEDLSQIWSAFMEPYRLSVVYSVSVVQIESRLRRRMAVPVQTRRVHLPMLTRPQIDQVERVGTPNDLRLTIGEDLAIAGANFRSQTQNTWVRIGSLAQIWINGPTNRRITITIPDATYPQDPDDPDPNPVNIPVDDRLQPGPHEVEVLVEGTVEVVQGGLDRGEWITEPQVLYSNKAVMMLVPEITSLSAAAGTTSDLLTVNGTRLYHEDHPSFVLIGDVQILIRDPEAGDPWNPPTDIAVEIPLTALSGLDTGVQYPVRVMVNGAQSRGLNHLFELLP